MKKYVAVICILLSGCALPPETQGSVYQFNGDTVTIRGGFDTSPGSGSAKPTPGMIAQAKEICPGATYLSASPTPNELDTFLYLFRC